MFEVTETDVPALLVVEPSFQPAKVYPVFDKPAEAAKTNDSPYVFVPLAGAVPPPLVSYEYVNVWVFHSAVSVKLESDAGTVHVAPPAYVLVPSLQPANE